MKMKMKKNPERANMMKMKAKKILIKLIQLLKTIKINR
jgi:hypothetical protein